MATQPSAPDSSRYIPADVWNNRAIDAFEAGDTATAEAHWQRALERDPQHLETIFNQSLHQWRTGQISDERMLFRLEEVAANRGHDWLARYVLGQALLERGEVERARAELSAALALNPGSSEIRQTLDLANAEPTADDLVLHDYGADIHIFGPSTLHDDALPVESMEAEAYAELLSSYAAHLDTIYELAWSSDGGLLASSSRDGSVRVWDMRSGECLRVLLAPDLMPPTKWSIRKRDVYVEHRVIERPGNYPIGISFARTGGEERLLASLSSGHVALWSLVGDHAPDVIEVHDNAVIAAHIVADGQSAITACADGTVRGWSLPAWAQTWEDSVSNPHIRGTAISRDGRSFATCDLEAEIKIWDTVSGEVRQRIQEKRPLWNIDFDPDGDHLITGNNQLWEISSGRLIHTFQAIAATGQMSYFRSAGSHVGGVIHTYTSSGIATLDAHNPRTLRRYPWSYGHGEGHLLTAVQLDPFESRLAAASDEGRLRVWQLRSIDYRAELRRSQERSNAEIAAAANNVESILGKIRQALERNDDAVALNLLNSLRAAEEMARAPETLHWTHRLERRGRRTNLRGAWQSAIFEFEGEGLGGGRIASLSSDGKQLVSFDQGSFGIWNLDPVELIHTVDSPGEGLTPVGLSSDHQLAVWQDWSSSGNWPILVTSTRTGNAVARMDGGSSYAEFARFSHDNRFLATVNDSAPVLMTQEEPAENNYELSVWEVATGRLLRRLRGSDGVTLALAMTDWFSDAFIATETGSLDHWDIPTGSIESILNEHTDRIHSIDVNADLSQLVTASEDDTVRFWHADTSASYRQLNGYSEVGVGFVRIVNDGQAVLHEEWTDCLVLRDAVTGERLRQFKLSRAPSWRFEGSLSANSRWLALGFYGGQIRVWYLDWNIEIPEPADWDEGARPFLNAFLRRQQPYAGELPADREPSDEEIRLALTKTGRPVWSDDDFAALQVELQDAGYGWLRPQGVQAELERMADTFAANAAAGQ